MLNRPGYSEAPSCESGFQGDFQMVWSPEFIEQVEATSVACGTQPCYCPQFVPKTRWNTTTGVTRSASSADTATCAGASPAAAQPIASDFPLADDR